MKTLRIETDYLLAPKYRKVGKLVCVLGWLVIVLIARGLLSLGFDRELLDEFISYFLHLPFSLGLYFILFAKEKKEDEFYLSLRLKSISRGVVLLVLSTAMLPVLSNLHNLIIGENIALPDVGGNLAVCTLLLIYSNIVYWYNKRKLA
jgi:hypothetical protein